MLGFINRRLDIVAEGESHGPNDTFAIVKRGRGPEFSGSYEMEYRRTMYDGVARYLKLDVTCGDMQYGSGSPPYVAMKSEGYIDFGRQGTQRYDLYRPRPENQLGLGDIWLALGDIAAFQKTHGVELIPSNPDPSASV
jgi:hypothetical protein